jgi:prepilin-type N-terminal cleavage/methylation domain-containing protein
MKRNNGFSLIEITVVVVVIAVILGGFFGAHSIIRNSERQAVISEFKRLSVGLQNFVDTYHELPGDFSTATAQWGEVSPSCHVGAATGTQTCNGDGNSKTEIDPTKLEHIAAMRHLGLSGFFNENFSGNTVAGGACGMDIRASVNVPASKLKGASWYFGTSVAGVPYTMDSGSYVAGSGTQFIPMNVCTTDVRLHVLWLGGSLQDDDDLPAGCAASQIPVMTGAEAYLIDKKVDDGRFAFGKIRGQYNNTTTYQSCEDSTNSSGGYRTDSNGMNCSLAFILRSLI